MEILRWVSKGAHEQEKGSNTFNFPTTWEARKGEKSKGKDMIALKHHKECRRTKRTEGRKLSCKNLKLFIFICGKDIPKACFYRTVNLNKVGNMNLRRRFVHSVKMKREELSGGVGITKRADFAAHVGKKVLPITETSFSNSTKGNDQCVTAETKGDSMKPISRMKQLLRRLVGAKAEKSEKFYEQKGLQFMRQGNIDADPYDDPCSSESSPKISFTWDVETYLSENEKTQISHSEFRILPKDNGHVSYRKGNWITTDSEFVVLEL